MTEGCLNCGAPLMLLVNPSRSVIDFKTLRTFARGCAREDTTLGFHFEGLSNSPLRSL